MVRINPMRLYPGIEYDVVVKGPRNSQMEEMHRAREGERARSFHALSKHSTLLISPCVGPPRSSLNPAL